MNIDTVIVDLGAGIVSIVRRATISARTEVRQLELGTWLPGTGLQLDPEMQQAAKQRAAQGAPHGR